MNRAAYAVLAAGAIVTAAASYQLKQLNRDIRQARLLYGQMEDDHSQLVRMVIKVSDRLAPYNAEQRAAIERLAKNTSNRIPADDLDLAFGGEDE